MARRRVSTAIAVACALLAVALSGCGPAVSVTFVPDAPARTYAQVETDAEAADLGAAARVSVEDAADARSEALVWLRKQGTDGDRAASLLTTGFPTRTRAVPVLVQIGDVDGVRSLVVVEAYGDATGSLSHRRLWVFDWESGRLLHSSSYR